MQILIHNPLNSKIKKSTSSIYHLCCSVANTLCSLITQKARTKDLLTNDQYRKCNSNLIAIQLIHCQVFFTVCISSQIRPKIAIKHDIVYKNTQLQVRCIKLGTTHLNAIVKMKSLETVLSQ